MKFKWRRSDRPTSARNRLGLSLESLEIRQLLSRDTYSIFSVYAPSDLPIRNPQNGEPVPFSAKGSLRQDKSTSNSLLNNEGKIVSGQDRQGDQWTITVHGPGEVIVTDITPGDGELDDPINTIQLVGTNINTTYVTGTVLGSNQVATDSTVDFNQLIANQGVNSIKLNGFTLTETVAPASGLPNNENTGIYLPGGVRTLEFHNIVAPVDELTADFGITIVIGDPSTPLKVKPSIKIDSIFNTVFDSSAASTDIPTTPLTDPSVSIIVNGQIQSLAFTSTGQGIIPDALGYQFPIVGTTGRTAVQATAIHDLRVRGSATNFTASRSAQPFQNGFSGLSRLDTATFEGKTDAVGLDVNGPIRRLEFRRGLGSPTGTFVAQNDAGQSLPATAYGQPAGQSGYPAAGLLGGQITATRIGRLDVGPANLRLQVPTNPAFVQINRQGSTYYVPRLGNAITSSVITTSGNIGKANIAGDVVNTEIKSGFHYGSFAAGLEGTRAASRIRRANINGNTLNGVVSSTYRTPTGAYGTTDNQAGNGSINGNLTGSINSTGGTTGLGNIGTGFFARRKAGGYLPPPSATKSIGGIHQNRG